jgi:hypothetical protein
MIHACPNCGVRYTYRKGRCWNCRRDFDLDYDVWANRSLIIDRMAPLLQEPVEIEGGLKINVTEDGQLMIKEVRPTSAGNKSRLLVWFCVFSFFLLSAMLISAKPGPFGFSPAALIPIAFLCPIPFFLRQIAPSKKRGNRWVVKPNSIEIQSLHRVLRKPPYEIWRETSTNGNGLITISNEENDYWFLCLRRKDESTLLYVGRADVKVLISLAHLIADVTGFPSDPRNSWNYGLRGARSEAEDKALEDDALFDPSDPLPSPPKTDA